MTDFISFIHANAFYIRIFFLAADVIMFLLYGSDKRKAAKGRWRISERSLLSGAIFGGIGAYLGMLVFRHKTRKTAFRILLPFYAGIQAAVLLWI